MLICDPKLNACLSFTTEWSMSGCAKAYGLNSIQLNSSSLFFLLIMNQCFYKHTRWPFFQWAPLINLHLHQQTIQWFVRPTFFKSAQFITKDLSNIEPIQPTASPVSCSRQRPIFLKLSWRASWHRTRQAPGTGEHKSEVTLIVPPLIKPYLTQCWDIISSPS